MVNYKNNNCNCIKNNTMIYKENCNIILCKCNYCNHCHIGGFCPDHKYWFENINSNNERKPILPGQSHGGHMWVPECNNIYHDL